MLSVVGFIMASSPSLMATAGNALRPAQQKKDDRSFQAFRRVQELQEALNVAVQRARALLATGT